MHHSDRLCVQSALTHPVTGLTVIEWTRVSFLTNSSFLNAPSKLATVMEPRCVFSLYVEKYMFLEIQSTAKACRLSALPANNNHWYNNLNAVSLIDKTHYLHFPIPLCGGGFYNNQLKQLCFSSSCNKLYLPLEACSEELALLSDCQNMLTLISPPVFI